MKLVDETKQYVFYRLKHKHVTRVYFQVLWKCDLLFRPFTILVAILELVAELTVDRIELTTSNGPAQGRVKETLPEIWTLWTCPCKMGYYSTFNQRQYVAGSRWTCGWQGPDPFYIYQVLPILRLASHFDLPKCKTDYSSLLNSILLFPPFCSSLSQLGSVWTKMLNGLKKNNNQTKPCDTLIPSKWKWSHSWVFCSHSRLRRDTVVLQIL